MKVSVLITSYNRAEYLRKCLYGYLRQDEGGFEIIVTDDGSSDHTADVVREYGEIAPFPVTFLQQEDKGHRRVRAINRAVAAARADWLLFSDCDSIPRSDLVRVHRRYAEEGRLLCGGRVLLGEEFTSGLTKEDVLEGRYEEAYDGKTQLFHWLQHVKNCYYVLIRKTRRPHNYAVNMSCSRESMEAVNGYDHNFKGWGNADGDLRDRMRKVGIQPKSVFYQAEIFHLWHEPDPTMEERRNKGYARRPHIPARCKKGLDEVKGTVPQSSEPFPSSDCAPLDMLDSSFAELARQIC